MRIPILATSASLALCILLAGADTRQEQVVEKLFPRKGLIKIWTMAGNVQIESSATDSIAVQVIYAPLPRESFIPIFEESGNELSLREQVEDSYDGGSSWTLHIPRGIRVECSSLTGGVSFKEVAGDFFCSTKAGDIRVEDCGGRFDLHSVSGDLEAREVKVDSASNFASLSGSVTVVLAQAPTCSLTVSSSFDDAVLDYHGHPISGTFEFSARAVKGDIFAPFDFDRQEEFLKDDLSYIRKVFTRGQAEPFIQIRTSEGTARLKE